VKRLWIAAILFALLVAVVIALTKWPKARNSNLAAQQLRTAAVEPASFEVTLAVSGVVDAAKFYPIVNESSETQIIWLLTDGTPVKFGDLIIKLNEAKLKKEVGDQERQDAEAAERSRAEIAEARKRVQNANSSQQKAQDDLKLAQVEGNAAIEKANAEIEFMQKELELAQGQLDKRKRLADERLMPLSQVEEAADQARAKQFGLEKAKRELERAKQEAEATERIKQLDMHKAGLELTLAESALARSQAEAIRSQRARTDKLEDARRQLAQAEVRAPFAGTLLLERTWDDGMRTLRVGDRVHEGQRIANIVDLGQMRVKCDISEGDIEHVKPGQEARIRVAAIGDRELLGTVQNIDNLAKERGWWEGGTPGKQIFGATIALSSRDKRLRPGMSASVQIVLARADQGLGVPLDAVFESRGRPVVYRLEADGYREVPVKLLQRNDMMAAVTGSLKARDKVACDRPPVSALLESGESHK